jgi:putative acetyltransferase
VLIRRERAGDEKAVHRIHQRAFGAGDTSRSGHPGAPPAEATLVDRLRSDPEAWLPRLSLVAEEGELPIGHVVCSRGRLRQQVPALGLGPIGVLPRHQGRGVGTALVHAVCAAADALDEPLVLLLGDPGYYRRTGFVLAERFGITPPVPEWAPHFQVRTLSGFDPAVHHGGFRYAAAFDRIRS